MSVARTGRLHLVTGAAGGIGTSVTRRLIKDGHGVLITDRDPIGAAVLADEVGAPWMELDVTEPESWAEVVDRLKADGCDVHGLILNAGVAGLSSPTEFDLERYRQGFAVNVDGVVNGLVALGPLLQRSGDGSVVITASIAGLTGITFDPFYAMTKHAVIGLVRSIADDFRDRGLTIQAVCPGLVDTELLGEARRVIDQAEFPLLAPDDIAAAVAECLNGDRADLVTVLQPGREPIAYRFAGIPGPGGTTTAMPTELTLGRRSGS